MFALDIPRVPVDGAFTGQQVRRAIAATSGPGRPHPAPGLNPAVPAGSPQTLRRRQVLIAADPCPPAGRRRPPAAPLAHSHTDTLVISTSAPVATGLGNLQQRRRKPPPPPAAPLRLPPEPGQPTSTDIHPRVREADQGLGSNWDLAAPVSQAPRRGHGDRRPASAPSSCVAACPVRSFGAPSPRNPSADC